jgi:hypothetical protein
MNALDIFVIVALAVLVLSLGAVGVAAVGLKRAVSGLAAAGRSAGERMRPLAAELQAEQAVSALELEALQRTLAARKPSPRTRG